MLLTDDGIFDAMAHMTRYDGWAITTRYGTQRGTAWLENSESDNGESCLLETLFWLKRSREGEVIEVYMHR